MEKYDTADAGSSGTWEEELLKIANKETAALPAPKEEYDVTVPEMPKRVKDLRKKEEEITKGIYE